MKVMYRNESKLSDKVKHSLTDYISSHKKEDIRSYNGKYNNVYLNWYMEWLQSISLNEHDLWMDIRKHKNNITFINLVLLHFEEILQSKIDHLLKKPSVKLNSYYHYANELFIEVYGKELLKLDYKKSELLQIIKECETVIQSNIMNNSQPSHNVVLLNC